METLDALRGYVHFLHEREGVRAGAADAARRGRGWRSWPQQSARQRGSRRLPGDGARACSRAATTSSRRHRPRGSVAAPTARRRTTRSARRGTHRSKSPARPRPSNSRHLGERASVCVKCPHLAARRHTVVFGVGNPEAQLMFVGEAPGEEEDLQGEPFVGRAGQLLTKMIVAMGLDARAGLHRQHREVPARHAARLDRQSQADEAGDGHLRALPARADRRDQAAVDGRARRDGGGRAARAGRHASASCAGNSWSTAASPLMPTYHPSYLLRNQSNTEKRKVWEDLLQVMERTGDADQREAARLFSGEVVPLIAGIGSMRSGWRSSNVPSSIELSRARRLLAFEGIPRAAGAPPMTDASARATPATES